MFVSNPSTLAHICQSIRYNLVSVLLLSRFVKVRCLSHGVKATSAPNPIQSIRFSQIVPHFHSISTPYPLPYGFPPHWRALLRGLSPPPPQDVLLTRPSGARGETKNTYFKWGQNCIACKGEMVKLISYPRDNIHTWLIFVGRKQFL